MADQADQILSAKAIGPVVVPARCIPTTPRTPRVIPPRVKMVTPVPATPVVAVAVVPEVPVVPVVDPLVSEKPDQMTTMPTMPQAEATIGMIGEAQQKLPGQDCSQGNYESYCRAFDFHYADHRKHESENQHEHDADADHRKHESENEHEQDQRDYGDGDAQEDDDREEELSDWSIPETRKLAYKDRNRKTRKSRKSRKSRKNTRWSGGKQHDHSHDGCHDRQVRQDCDKWTNKSNGSRKQQKRRRQPPKKQKKRLLRKFKKLLNEVTKTDPAKATQRHKKRNMDTDKYTDQRTARHRYDYEWHDYHHHTHHVHRHEKQAKNEDNDEYELVCVTL